MSNITEIDFASVPPNLKLLEKGKKTKKICFKSESAHLDDEKTKEFADYVSSLPYDEYITIAKGSSEELKIIGESGVKMEPISIYFKNNSAIENKLIGDRGALGISSDGSFLVEFDELVTIQSSRSSYVYYEEYNPIELKPMPKIDKLTDSSSFENVSNKLQEINNLLKVGSDNLKTIMDANYLIYEPTDKFTDLVQKLNDKPNRPSTLMSGNNFRDKISSIPNIKNIKEIKFIKDIPNPNGIDVSEAQDKSIMASLDGGTVLTIACNNEIIANENCSNMFNASHAESTLGKANINKICFDNFNTKNVIDMEYMFGASMADSDFMSDVVLDVVELTNIENWDVSNVTNMKGMFYGCYNLETLDLSGWDVSNVKDMSHMFNMSPKPNKLSKIIGIEDWHVSSLMNTDYMFYIQYDFLSLDLSKWNGNKIVSMNYMFALSSCLSGSITITNPNVETYELMFAYSSAANISKFIVNYIDDATKEIAKKMVETKRDSSSNVVLGTLVSQ